MTQHCERFRSYILDKTFKICTDNKPFLGILKTNNMDVLNPYLKRFRMRLNEFDFNIVVSYFSTFC